MKVDGDRIKKIIHIGINGRSIFRQLTGVQHYAREITRALCELGDESTSFTVFSGREGQSGPEGNLPLKPGFFPAGGPLRGLIWEQALLRRMVKKTSVDVLFNPANMAPLYPPVTSVVTVHDLSFLLFPGFFSRSFARYYREAIPRILNQAQAVITDSENTRADLVRYLGLAPEKITVVPLGVSPEFRKRPSAQTMADVRSRYCLPASFFLSISSLEPRKNLKALIRAYRLLPEDLRNEHSLVLAGAGGRIFSDPAISEELSRLDGNNVLTIGYVPTEDLIAIYRMSLALVYPSLYEGFGLPVLEAMAASTPVITSNRSSLPEVAGPAAVLIDPESIEEIAAAMELMASDSGTRNLLIERGKKRSADFTWEKAASRTLEVLKAAAGAAG